jgi:transcriptional regulator with XRE-family HTH domain
MFPMERIGRRKPLRWYLREWREAKGLTQERVAGLIGTNKGQVSKLERGDQRMNEDWMILFAEALGVEPSELLRDPAAPSREGLFHGLQPADQERVIHFAEALKNTA